MTKAIETVSQARRAIQLAKTPAEANEARARLKAIQKYLARRAEQFEVAFEAAKLQCEAAAKAGELWAAETDRHRGGRPAKKPVEVSTGLRVADARFSDRPDA